MEVVDLDKLDALNRTVLFSEWLYPKVSEFDRKHKFTLGDRIIHYGDMAQEKLLEANEYVDKSKAAKKVTEAIICIKMLSIKTRIACNIGTMSIHDKAYCDIQIGEIVESTRHWRTYFLRMHNKSKKGESGSGHEPFPESQE